MKKIALILLSITATLYSLAQSPSWQWARNAGGSMDDIGQSITHDAFGNVYVTGSFDSPFITVGSTTLINTTGGDGCFTAKYDSSGNVLWAVAPSGSCYGLGISTDPSGYIYITGGCTGDSIQFGNILLTNANNKDFIAKYDSSGNVVWAINAGSEADYGRGITTDTHGNIYFTGEFYHPHISFGLTTLNLSPGLNYSDVFIVKLDSSGNVIWAKSGGGNSYDKPSSIAIDAAGAAYITGYFESSTITFDTITFINSNADDFFIVKYDSSGNVAWAHQGNSVYGHAKDIAVDHADDVYITGDFWDPTLTFGSTTLINSGGYANLFIIKYNSSGSVLWAQSAGINDFAEGHTITTDANNNVYVSGDFASDSATFGGITLINPSGFPYFHAFIAKYNSSGIAIWAKDFGAYDAGTCVDDFGNFYMTGTLGDSVALFDNDTIFGHGGGDCFVAKLGSQITTSTFDFTSPVLPILIYPNPAINNFTILLSGNNKKVEVNITDITGKIIYKTTGTETQKIEVNTKEFAEGIYLVKIKSYNFLETRKLIITK